MKIRYLLVLTVLLLTLASPVLATSTPSYMTIVSYNGVDTALVNVDQWRASADYPATISTKPDPSTNSYYNVIIDQNGNYPLQDNAWVMLSDMKIYSAFTNDPFPNAPGSTPTPIPSSGYSSSVSSSAGDWNSSAQGFIDQMFNSLQLFTELGFVAVIMLLIKKLVPSNKKGGLF